MSLPNRFAYSSFSSYYTFSLHVNLKIFINISVLQLCKGNAVAVLDLLWSIIYRTHAPKVTQSAMEFVFMDELLFWCLEEVSGEWLGNVKF